MSPSSDLVGNVPQLIQVLEHHPSILIFTRSDPQFAQERRIHNRAIDSHPWAIACPASEMEVATVVRILSKSVPAVPILIRVGGHDLGGRCLLDNGVVIDLRHLKHISFAEDRASVRVGGGALSGAVVKLLDSHGLTTPTGWCDTVGYVGWATGGGYGSMQGTHGFGVDQIVGGRMVLANGDIVDTEEDENLLWVLKGAGTGSFGVVSELRIKTFPIPKMLAGKLVFAMQDAQRVLTGVGNLCSAHHPDEFSGDFLIQRLPGNGCVLVCLFSRTQRVGRHNEKLQDGWAFLENIRRLGKVLINTVTETTPCGYAADIQKSGVPDTKIFLRSRLVKGLTPNFAKIIAENSPLADSSIIVIHNAHGESTRRHVDAAFPNRSPHLVLGIFGAAGLNKGPSIDAATKWVDDYIRLIDNSGETVKGGYMSFAHPRESDTLGIFNVSATERLRRLKVPYDAANVFSRGYRSLL